MQIPLERSNQATFLDNKKKEALKNGSQKDFKREKQFHPSNQTLSSLMLYVCATLFVLPSFICHIFCPLILVCSSLSVSSPSFFSQSLHLGSSSWQPLNLCKSEGAGRIGVTMACASSLICLDHGYGAYLDNKTACQHLPSHTLPHAKQTCIWE